MPQMVFVNLPARDIDRARAFYEGVGFTINPQFSDDSTICVVVSDTIFLMVMTPDKFAGFAPRPVGDPSRDTSVLVALTRNSKEGVDAFLKAALAHGGTDNAKPQDIDGFMYGQSVSDPDGNVIELVWMNPGAVGG